MQKIKSKQNLYGQRLKAKVHLKQQTWGDVSDGGNRGIVKGPDRDGTVMA